MPDFSVSAGRAFPSQLLSDLLYRLLPCSNLQDFCKEMQAIRPLLRLDRDLSLEPFLGKAALCRIL
jgi:hypothetical protein